MSQTNNTLEILMDCTRVSSGTLATLTGFNTYEKLDAIHADFIRFVQQVAHGYRWRTWVDAWAVYAESRNQVAKSDPNV